MVPSLGCKNVLSPDRTFKLSPYALGCPDNGTI